MDATRSGIIETPLASSLLPALETLHNPTTLEVFAQRADRDAGISLEAARSLVADLLSYRIVVSAPPRTLILLGSGPLADALTPALTHARLRVRRPLLGEPLPHFLASADPTAVLAIVDELAAAPLIAARSRHRTGPVVPISTVDSRVFIGPVGIGRSGPCPRCCHLYHRDRDSSWDRVIGHAPTEPDPVVVLAGAAAAGRILRRLCAVPDPPGVSAPDVARGTRVIVDPYSPVPETHEVLSPHPSCPVCY
ncbi:hypothetical protein [Corynebacterium capitovis]|uniref:hypothetical protein n=1 Tax=Corynebacterium capitovis TaxID=131081 RepID=UPI0003AA1762|nr:hypothetical protein [Corynebacterium capitovis]